MEIIDIQFDENATTQERLIKATQALIAVYGYDATTTRMIANLANVALSAINFHFGSKENLVKASLEAAASDLRKKYEKMACEIRRFLKKKPVDKEQAWSYLDRFLADRIRTAFNYKASWINIGIEAHESGFPENLKGIMSEVAVQTNEQVLAELILTVSDKQDPFKAAVIARTICAAIMSYTEKPLLNQYLGEHMEADLEDREKYAEYLHEYAMKSIEAAVVISPGRKVV
jgi:AcrR family transcriptional regulator